jgi:hypothetical protein
MTNSASRMALMLAIVLFMVPLSGCVSDGVDGMNGEAGSEGPQGPSGADGEDGLPGVN